jgi:hypothetical protein
MRELSETQAFLPAQVAVSMLEELAASFADPQLQTDTLNIGIFCFPAGTFGIVGRNGFYAAFGERESFGHKSSFERSF